MPIEVKLVVDKTKKKVVFAECETDFVDVLFSFLTLPLGVVIKLLNKQSGLKCMDNLYKSVENLDAEKYLQTALCKTMLLQPKSEAGEKCEGLVVNICDELKPNPKEVFWCSNWECVTKDFPYYTLMTDVKCGCGRVMNIPRIWAPEESTSGSVFLKRAGIRFLVSDDLNVFRVVSDSFSAAFPVLECFGVKDMNGCVVMKVEVDKTQVLNLLRSSLVSKTPLTDVFLSAPTTTAATKSKAIEEILECLKVLKLSNDLLSKNVAKSTTSHTPKVKKDNVNETAATATVKIFESKRVKFIEADNDFADLLFSFLTFPLGKLISLANATHFPILGGIRNLYTSVNYMKAGNDEEIMSVQSKEMLLCPYLPHHFGCSNKILKVDEIQPHDYGFIECKTCFEKNLSCSHNKKGVPAVPHTEINPKSVEISSESGGGFAREGEKFIVTADMTVKPFSVVSVLEILEGYEVSIDDLRERVVTIDETKALSFLMACLTSSNGIIDSLLF